MPNGNQDRPRFGQPDLRTEQARASDRAKAASRVERAQAWRADRQTRRDFLDLLDRRRRGSPAHDQVERIEPDGETELLVVRDQLLTTATALQDGSFTDALSEIRWARRTPRAGEDRLEDRVALLAPAPQATGAQPDSVDAALERLSATGRRVTRTYLTPLGVVMKSHQTPEPTERPWPVRPQPGPTGPVRIAVVDTGIALQPRPDRWVVDLQANGETDPLDVLPPPGDGLLDAGAGHGTFVAGVAQQIVPDAEIRVYQALDSDGLASELRVASTIVRTVDEMLATDGRLVVNLSLGGETTDDRPPLALEAAVAAVQELAAGRGGEVLLVAAAGNEGRDRKCWPAAFPEVVAVAGLMPDLTPAPFSSRGDWVRCSTIAAGVRGPYVEGQESSDFDDDPETWLANTWAQWTGTSFAAPQVAGAVAKLAGDSGSTLAQALSALLAGGTPVPGYGTAVRILG
jgi:subtilisin family serine protease